MVTGVKPIGGGAMKSRKLARKVTASYHTIKNELNALAKSKSDEMTKIKVAELEGRLEEIGGIALISKRQLSPPSISRRRDGYSAK